MQCFKVLLYSFTIVINIKVSFAWNRLHPFIYTPTPNREDAFCTWKYCEVELSFCKDIKTANEEKICKDENKMVVKWSKSYFGTNHYKCCDWRTKSIKRNYLYCVYGFQTKYCKCKYTIFRWTWDIRVKHCSNGFDCNYKAINDEKCFDKQIKPGNANTTSKVVSDG